MSNIVVCEASVKLKKGDITAESTDGIVNLTNAKLNRSSESDFSPSCSSPTASKHKNWGRGERPPTGTRGTTSPLNKNQQEGSQASHNTRCRYELVERQGWWWWFGWNEKEMRKVETTISEKVTDVSKAIFDAAGPDIKEECERLAKLPNEGYVVTSAGNMKCGKIIHLLEAESHNIVPSMMKALKACDQNKMATVSFPAMGTGEDNLDPDISIRHTVKGIEDYLSDPTVMTDICEINIVVFEPDIYEKYQRFVQNYKTNYPQFWAFGKMIELIKGDITHQAADCVVNLANASLNQTSGVSGAILKAAGDTVKEECKKIGTLNEDEVAITSGGKLVSKNIMHIIGPTRVPDYQPSIDKILQECHKNGFTSVALPAIGTATDLYPKTWTDMEKSEFQDVILKEASDEYKEVKDKFFKTISEKKYQIMEIKRIQNAKYWQSFTINKHSVNKKNPGQKNIRHLYHGTHSNAIGNINRDGFNRVYCGKNATAYGNGTYFAEDSEYSCRDTYSCPDAGMKYMYQAAVITGRYCKGDSSYKEAPHVDGDPNKGRYDSVVDDVVNPKMYVVFHDDVAYPEYLISFKKY